LLQVEKAVKFLLDKKVARTALEDRRQFLGKKGADFCYSMFQYIHTIHMYYALFKSAFQVLL